MIHSAELRKTRSGHDPLKLARPTPDAARLRAVTPLADRGPAAPTYCGLAAGTVLSDSGRAPLSVPADTLRRVRTYDKLAGRLPQPVSPGGHCDVA